MINDYDYVVQGKLLIDEKFPLRRARMIAPQITIIFVLRQEPLHVLLAAVRRRRRRAHPPTAPRRRSRRAAAAASWTVG